MPEMRGALTVYAKPGQRSDLPCLEGWANQVSEALRTGRLERMRVIVDQDHPLVRNSRRAPSLRYALDSGAEFSVSLEDAGIVIVREADEYQAYSVTPPDCGAH